MTQPIHNPHDTFFRETFSRREVAEDVLREYLPPELVEGIDWSTLEISKDSFVEKALRKHFSDLVYDVRHGQRNIKIYLLFEHKSSPEHWVALQLLRYQVRIWELYRKQHPDEPLPPIVPLVLYHGRTDWRAPKNFQALFGGLDEALASYVPVFCYELCDLHLPEPEEIRGRLLSRVILLALKHIFDPSPKQALSGLMPLLRDLLEQETSREMLEVLLRYYIHASGTLDEQDIRELLTETARGEDYMQTFIDRYIEQGRQQGLVVGEQKGLVLGEQKGRQEGRQEERQDLLLRQMTRKFGTLTAKQRTRIRQADGETLLRWSEQVLFATTAEEALR
jgi:predicted transposase/invertase (TIGR01784 family)